MTTSSSCPCPRCADTVLVDGVGALHEAVCPDCRGRFLDAEATTRVVVDELGVDRQLLHEIAEHFSGPRLRCPACPAAMRPLRLQGVLVDLCFACGGLWLDAGELHRLSSGRHVEIAPTAAEIDAVVPAAAVGARLKLVAGAAAVVFRDPGVVDVKALARVFVGIDGRTAIDAKMLIDSGSCVVVDAIDGATADVLAARCADEGVDVEVWASADLASRVALTTSTVRLDDDALVLQFHTSAERRIAFSDVVAVAAGIVKKGVSGDLVDDGVSWLSGLRGLLQNTDRVEPMRARLVARVLTVEILARVPAAVGDGGTQRVRLMSPPTSREQLIAVVERLEAAGAARGRRPVGGSWPVFVRPQDLERDAIHAAWKAQRWPLA